MRPWSSVHLEKAILYCRNTVAEGPSPLVENEVTFRKLQYSPTVYILYMAPYLLRVSGYILYGKSLRYGRRVPDLDVLCGQQSCRSSCAGKAVSHL